MTWVVGITVAALIALGAPIFVALLSAAALALLLFPGPPLIALQQTIFGGLDAYLIAVNSRTFRECSAWLERGLAAVNNGQFAILNVVVSR